MKHAERELYRVTPMDGEIATGALPNEASREADSSQISGDAWSALLQHAQSCNAHAFDDLYQRLKRFRQCFTPPIFPDPEGAYRQFVSELVDQIRSGALLDPDALFTQARNSAVRKASHRINCLTMAARVLSTLPKRHREVLIRAQLTRDLAPLDGEDLHGGPARPADSGNSILPTLRKPIVRGTSRIGCKTPSAVA
jgi:hypothetical protein